MACIVLHNIATKLRLPVPDDGDNDDCDDQPEENHAGHSHGGADPTLSGRATRARVTERFFSE